MENLKEGGYILLIGDRDFPEHNGLILRVLRLGEPFGGPIWAEGTFKNGHFTSIPIYSFDKYVKLSPIEIEMLEGLNLCPHK